jgi:hypothetical protein
MAVCVLCNKSDADRCGDHHALYAVSDDSDVQRSGGDLPGSRRNQILEMRDDEFDTFETRMHYETLATHIWGYTLVALKALPPRFGLTGVWMGFGVFNLLWLAGVGVYLSIMQ